MEEQKPNPRRRHEREMRTVDITPDDMVVHSVESYTRDDGTTYHPVIDAVTKQVDCTCPDFEIRCARFLPRTYSPPAKLCKHLIDALLLNHAAGIIALSALQVHELQEAQGRRRGQRYIDAGEAKFVSMLGDDAAAWIAAGYEGEL